MKKFKHITLGGIQQKIFNLVIITIILMMAVYTAVIMYQVSELTDLVSDVSDSQKRSITEISEQTMTAVLDTNLTQSTRMEAYIAEDVFGDAVRVVKVIADYTGKLFADPGAYPARAVSLPDKNKDGEISAQVLAEQGVNISDPAIKNKLGLIGNLSDLMTAVYADANVDSCYAALPDGVMLLVDDHSGTKFDANGDIIPIPIRERMWYTGAAETGELYYTDVTTDLFTGEISIMCSLPVYQDGKLVAVIGADLFLNDVSDAVNNTARSGSFVCIVNNNGHVLFSPQTDGVFSVLPSGEAKDLRADENTRLAGFVRDALEKNTELRLIEVDGEQCYVIGSPIQSVGWTVISVVPKSLADQPAAAMLASFNDIQSEATDSFNKGISNARATIIVLIAVVVILSITVAVILSKRIVKPLEAITARVRSLGGDDLQFQMEDTYRTGDEIEVLAESFAMLSGKTLEYISTVQRVTAEKERIGAELSLATRIQADMLPTIYPAFPERAEFDIFASMAPAKEVGGDFYDFFLIDDDHLCVFIADVSGKGVPAALFMMASMIILANNAQMGKSPAQILNDTNSAICANNREEMFVTAWIGILEISTGKLTAANAGHEYPVIKLPNGKYELLKDKHGFVIGGMEGAKYKEYEIQLEPGSKLFLYTDGVPEATDGDKKLFGTDRMLDALNAAPDASPKETLESVRGAVDVFVRNAEQFDDLTMVCIEYRGEAADPKAPEDPASDINPDNTQ
ncbi:MAG: SpoIIE family protein phosphatase [Clostridia bacterium]|nr:SpoIIE family protein phosphatase [Clostridia bacterium]